MSAYYAFLTECEVKILRQKQSNTCINGTVLPGQSIYSLSTSVDILSFKTPWKKK